jgi:DNA polymerase sigma
MFYTREQIQRLEKYRKTFETAVHSGFARNVGSIALKEIEEVYDEAIGSHYSYNSGCSVCVLQFLKRVGEPFLKEAEKYKKLDEKQAQELAIEENKLNDLQSANTNDSEPPKTNKKTRKKKVEDNGTE